MKLFSDEQIISVLCEAEVGVSARELCHRPMPLSSAASRPGVDAHRQKGFIGSFNGRFRGECLNEHGLNNVAYARKP